MAAKNASHPGPAQHWPEVVAVLLPAVFVLSWFRGPGVIYSVDSYFVLRPELAIHEALSSWSTLYSSGTPNFMPQTFIFYCVFLLLDRYIGLRNAELIVLMALVSSSALGMRYFLRALLPKKSFASSIAVALCSILYVANPFTSSYTWWRQTWFEFTWAIYPWLLGLLVASVSRRARLVRATCVGTIVLIIGAPGFTHVLLVPLGTMLLSFGVAAIVASPNKKRAAARVSAILLGWTVAIAWWLIPSLAYLKTFLEEWRVQYRAAPMQLLEAGSQFSNLQNVARFVGVLQLHLYHGTQPFFPWFVPYGRGVLSLSLFALPLLAASGVICLFLSWRKLDASLRAYATVCVLVALAGMFLMKGDNPPLAAINRGLLRLPLGAAWQHPYDKFGQVALISVLVLSSLGVTWLVAVTERCVRRPRFVGVTVSVVCVAIILVEGWPFFSGNVLTPDEFDIPGAVAVVPRWYDRLAFILRDVRGDTFQLPARDNGESAFAWRRGAQTNNDPVLENFNGGQPVVRMKTGNSYADRLIDMAKAELGRPRSAAVLSDLGFADIVVHHDWALNYMPVPDALTIEEHLRPTRPPPAFAILRSDKTARGLRLPIWPLRGDQLRVQFYVALANINREQTLLSTDNGLCLRWIPPGRLGLHDAVSSSSVDTDVLGVHDGQWLHIEVIIDHSVAEIYVDDFLAARGPFRFTEPLRSIFLGSSNRYKPFRGAMSAIAILSATEFLSFPAWDGMASAIIRNFRWRRINTDVLSEQPRKDEVVLLASARSGGLKIPMKGPFEEMTITARARLDDTTREHEIFETSNGTGVRWVPPGYFVIDDLSRPNKWLAIDTPIVALRPNQWFLISLHVEPARRSLFLNGEPIAQVSTTKPQAATSLFLGSASPARQFSGAFSAIRVTSDDQEFESDIDPQVKSAARFFGWRVLRPKSASPEYLFEKVGRLHLFLTPCPVPVFYVADEVDAVENETQVLQKLDKVASCRMHTAVITGEPPSGLSASHPAPVVLRIGPTTFNVMSRIHGKYLLVFDTSFSENWRARSLTGASRILQHLVVNGYANGFVISASNSDTVQIHNSKQWLVSQSVLFGCLLLVLATLGIIGTSQSVRRGVRR